MINACHINLLSSKITHKTANIASYGCRYLICTYATELQTTPQCLIQIVSKAGNYTAVYTCTIYIAYKGLDDIFINYVREKFVFNKTLYFPLLFNSIPLVCIIQIKTTKVQNIRGQVTGQHSCKKSDVGIVVCIVDKFNALNRCTYVQHLTLDSVNYPASQNHNICGNANKQHNSGNYGGHYSLHLASFGQLLELEKCFLYQFNMCIFHTIISIWLMHYIAMKFW